MISKLPSIESQWHQFANIEKELNNIGSKDINEFQQWRKSHFVDAISEQEDFEKSLPTTIIGIADSFGEEASNAFSERLVTLLPMFAASDNSQR